MPIVDYSQVTAATWAYVRPTMANAAFDKAVACNWLRKRGSIRIQGGAQAEFLTTLGGPAVHGHVARGATLNLDSKKILDKSKYNWREHAVLLRVEHIDSAANAGPYQQANLLETIRKNGMDQVGDDLESAFFGVREADDDSGNGILVGNNAAYPQSVYSMVNDPAGNVAVGGLSPATWQRWRPGHAKDLAANRPSELDLASMHVDCSSKIGGMPRVTFTDASGYKDLYRIVNVRRRQTNAMMADLGYKGFTFENIDYLYVPHKAMARGLGLSANTSAGTPTHGYIYLTIDPNHLFIVVHSKRFMMPSGKINQPGILADFYHIETQYCFGTDNREVHGIVYANHNAAA